MLPLCIPLPSPVRVLMIILICTEYLPLRRLQGSTWFRFCLCVEIGWYFGAVLSPTATHVCWNSLGGQDCCPVSALLKTHFSLPSISIENPSFMSCILRPSRGRGQLIQLNCRVLCGKGVWDWWFNPERSAKA